jgi:hypothetical protein
MNDVRFEGRDRLAAMGSKISEQSGFAQQHTTRAKSGN